MKHIEVISLDRIGLIGDITNVIRRMNGNISDHTANVKNDGKGTSISVFSADVEFGEGFNADSAFRRLRKIKNVRQVSITDK